MVARFGHLAGSGSSLSLGFNIACLVLVSACTSDLKDTLKAGASSSGEAESGSGCPAGNHAAAAGEGSKCEPCEVGSFCAPGAFDAVPCAAGTWDDDADPATRCSPWTQCSAGQYVERAGTNLRDQSCAPCAAGSFSADGSAPQCQRFTACAAGSFVRLPGTAKTDQTCAPCPEETYSAEADQLECRAWTECEGSELQPGAPTHDRVCSACSDTSVDAGDCEQDGSCDPGTELVDGTADGGAVACRACEAGQYCPGGVRDAQSCSGVGWDHDSDPATPCEEYSDCSAGEYVSSDGTARKDRECDPCPSETFSEAANAAQCAAFRSCEPGTFVSAEGMSDIDRTCAGCPAGSFSSGDDADSCTLWTDCQPGEFVSEVGSSTEDRLCQQCAAETYSEGLNAGACVAVGECAPGSVRVSAADAGSGPAECEPCEPGQFCAGADVEAVSCAAGTWDDDSDPATPCSAMTPCALGEYVMDAGDALHDRQCAVCEQGEFTDVSNAQQCEAWQTCEPGTYAAEAGTSTTDRSCVACESGSFSTLENVPACTAWATCAAPLQYVSNTPDPTTDRECGDCEAPEETLEDNADACVLATFQMTDGSVVFEAEHFHLQELNGSQHSWQLTTNESASGAACMFVGPEAAYQWSSPVGFAPELRFRVEFAATGLYYINLRSVTGAGGGGSDSCFTAIDSQLSGTYDFDDQVGALAWRAQALSVSSVGTHTVSIWPAEDGLCVDKIVISSDSALPVGEGPAESPEQ